MSALRKRGRAEVDRIFTRLNHVTPKLDICEAFLFIMEQLTSSLAPPRSSSKSSVASSSQQVAGSVAKRCAFSEFVRRVLTYILD